MIMATNGIRLDDLDRWLEPFLTVTSRKARRAWAQSYLRGLLGQGEGKDLLLIAIGDPPEDCQRS